MLGPTRVFRGDAPGFDDGELQRVLDGDRARVALHALVPGAYTRSHFRSTSAYLAPFRLTEAHCVPHNTQINPWMWPEGVQVEP